MESIDGIIPAGGDSFGEIVESPFVSVASQAQSTFSVDADGASYAYTRRSILSGKFPQKNAVRIEEYLNYFTFDYPDPQGDNSVAISSETGLCPWNTSHQLLRLGLKGKPIPEAEIPQANYLFLIDISGSMSSADKLPLLKKGLLALLETMRPDDRIAVVTYASGEKLVLESTPVSEKETIANAIKPLIAYGSTAGARAMKMAYDELTKNFIPGANNRIIMGTDGDFNVGVTSTDSLKRMVEAYAREGIYLTICGFGTGNLNDSMMETISNSGNGTYEYIDSEEEMVKVFVNERSRFVTVANDCKVQITFNPAAVDSFRLIGYENRKMENSDFQDDKKDAAEIGAGQTITALYEIIPVGNAPADASLGTFDFRYKQTPGAESIPLQCVLPALATDATLSENLAFASSLAAFGLTLRDSQYKGESSFQLAYELASTSIGNDPYGLRRQYINLIGLASEMNSVQASPLH